MSKASKLSIAILSIITIILISFTGFIVLEKQKVEQANTQLQSDLKKAKSDKDKSDSLAKKLQGDLDRSKDEYSKLKQSFDKATKKVEELTGEVAKVQESEQKAKAKYEELAGRESELKQKIEGLKLELAEAKEDLESDEEDEGDEENITDFQNANVNRTAPTQTAKPTPTGSSLPAEYTPSSAVDEQYWASLLQEKASLEVNLESVRSELKSQQIEMVELKKKNEELDIEAKTLAGDLQGLQEEIKYKTDVINNLSLELARTKNDKKFVADQLGKIREENGTLRAEMKQLVSSKAALEKSIVRLTQDKEGLSKKLVETENLIQSKIDEIWEVKESLDRTFKSTKLEPEQPDIELPPIVVNTEGQAVNFNTGMSNPGFDGKVVSINDENNFVIVNIGEKTGIKLGDHLSVYRGSNYIARLEVIQVRKDISAADIKDQWSKIQVGDIVR